MASKFKKGDNVILISGSDKGKIGKIISIKDSKARVEGINLVTIHQKPTSQQPGQIKKEERPVHISKISHVENGKAVKVKFVINNGEGKNFVKKDRVSKKTGKKID